MIFVFLVFYVRRLLWRIGRRRGIKKFNFFPTYASFGNAFQELQLLAEPRTENVIQEKAKDEADEDDNGQPEDEDDLNDQLWRIRNGNRIDKLRISRTLKSR
jgi:hypothetical protein